jgi:hypothetical protein
MREWKRLCAAKMCNMRADECRWGDHKVATWQCRVVQAGANPASITASHGPETAFGNPFIGVPAVVAGQFDHSSCLKSPIKDEFLQLGQTSLGSDFKALAAATKFGDLQLSGYAGLNQVDQERRQAELRIWVGSSDEHWSDAAEWSAAILQFVLSGRNMGRVYALQLARHPVAVKCYPLSSGSTLDCCASGIIGMDPSKMLYLLDPSEGSMDGQPTALRLVRQPAALMSTTISENYSRGRRHPCAVLLTAIGIFACCCGAAAAHGGGSGNDGTGHAAGGHSSGSHGRGHRGAGWRSRGDPAKLSAGNRADARRGWLVAGYGYFFASLPPYCTLLYWQGAEFYYAGGVYYEWNGTAGGYQEVEPPAALALQVASQQAVEPDLFVFPVEGQTNAQLEADRAECDRWASTQGKFDPNTTRPRNKAADGFAAQRDSYARADRLCLEARHYAVE